MTTTPRLGRALATSLVVCAFAAPAVAQTVLQSPAVLDADVPMSGLAVGDIDEDGHADVVTTPVGGNILFPNEYQIFLGQGDGAFVAGSTVSFVTPDCRSLHLVDWNDDDHLDIVTACANLSDQTLAVALGAGDGTFAAPTFHTGVVFGGSLAVADINGDDLPDAAMIHPGLPTGPKDLDLLISTPSGRVTVSAAPNGPPVYVELGDIDDDGDGDIVTGNFDGTISAYLLDGTTLTGPIDTVTTASIRDVALLDLDDDGLLDVAATDSNTSQVLTFLSNGDGTFAASSQAPGLSELARLAVGEMTGDGRDDVIVASYDSSEIGVLRNLGDGSLETVVVVSHAPSPVTPWPADIDGDGDLDIVAAKLVFNELSQLVDKGVVSVENRTYGGGSPYLDRGHALPGTNGYGIQLCTGTLVGGAPFTFEVTNALAGGTAFLVMGFSEINVPFKQGVLVPALDLLLQPIAIDGQGGFVIGGNWGTGLPSGLQFWMQYWWVDAGAVANFAGTNAVRATLP